MSDYEYQYCSWCFKKTKHQLVESHIRPVRDDYRCSDCGNLTVQCRLCENMAKGKIESDEHDGFLKEIAKNWNNEFCAEHDGSIFSFENLDRKLPDLEDYTELFERKVRNWKKIGGVVGGAIGGITVFGPLAFIAAPGIASFLGGTTILLGEASTGTAIVSLSGAALSSASLAAIGGPVGMAGGTAVLTAVGASLGGLQGAVISNHYFGEVQDFRIEKVNEGEGPALIFINGFLSQEDKSSKEWRNGVKPKFINNPWYNTSWEAKALSDIGNILKKGVGNVAFKKFFKSIAVRGSKKFASKINPFHWSLTVSQMLIDNPWHVAITKASMTGVLLADLISRTEYKDGFILMGHSLGTRVICTILETLSTKEEKIIKDVYLFGGTADRTDTKGWETVLKSVKGKIFNCYSLNDDVLKYTDKASATTLVSNPIGLGKIEYSSKKIINIDVSEIVSGHMEYKNNLNRILEKIDQIDKNWFIRLMRCIMQRFH